MCCFHANHQYGWHLRQINKVKKLHKLVPHELNAHEMKKRFDACVSLLLRNEGEPSLHRIISCDIKWILYDNRKRSASWLGKDGAPKQNPK